MTRNTPYTLPQDGYYGEPPNEYQQQPHYEQPADGQYQAYEGRAYDQYQSPPGVNAPTGAAQSYNGTNDQAYQRYPVNQSWSQDSEQYGPSSQQFPQQNYRQQQYGEQYPSPNQYPPQPNYGEEQYSEQAPQRPYCSPPAPHYNELPPSSNDPIDAFKSQYDQPGVPASEYNTPAAPEGDRGVMGALAGGVAGAYGGHKMGHHGFLGGIGGAVAGSMLEDAYKHHKEDEAERHRLQNPNPPPVTAHPTNNNSTAPMGNFHASSRHVKLEDRCTLVAKCANRRGRGCHSRIDLNDCLTNRNGMLLWAEGGNFAATARHIRLTDDGRALEAELGDGSGGWCHNKIWLDERITNDNGRLEFLQL